MYSNSFLEHIDWLTLRSDTDPVLRRLLTDHSCAIRAAVQAPLRDERGHAVHEPSASERRDYELADIEYERAGQQYGVPSPQWDHAGLARARAGAPLRAFEAAKARKSANIARATAVAQETCRLWGVDIGVTP